LSGSGFSFGKLVVQPTDALVPALIFAEFRLCDDAKDLLFQNTQIADREVAPVRHEGAGGQGMT
jgi:hypothetical protein